MAMKKNNSRAIFKYYTGNAMLNNALMAIEALCKLKNISKITPDVLLKLYIDKKLLKLNKRLKSYTMLFTNNGPLHNDKLRGDKIFDSLFKTIMSNVETEGGSICEISGLRFNTPFNIVYEKALRRIGMSEKEIKNRDTQISRIWLPLIGSLGSDAQALPLAKFTIQIHPICIAIIQFLPLSSLLYKGGILLVDSSNFEFARQFVADNTKEVAKKIEISRSTQPIDNIRHFSKGHYLLKAIEILEEKKGFEEVYSDLNLWSFSNSGTGASCEIERVPNSLIQKLIQLNEVSPKVRNEIKNILNNEYKAFSFLNALEDNAEWALLYPNVSGSGKKKVIYKGVSPAFMEAFFKVTGNNKQTAYARYIAYLIDKYKSKSFEKYLSGISAWEQKEYRIDLYAVLVEATRNQEWSMYHQFQIIDDQDQLPVKNTYFKLHKIIHYYYLHQYHSKQIPEAKNKTTNVKNVCEWLISLIQKDSQKLKYITDLTNIKDYRKVIYTNLIIRSFESLNLEIQTICIALYDNGFSLSKNGINELLRIYFSQPKQEIYDIRTLNISPELFTFNTGAIKWCTDIKSFSKDYLAYYFDKYKSSEEGKKPYKKFLRLALDISMQTNEFLYWFSEALENTNDFLKTQNNKKINKWSESLLYSPGGDPALSFAKCALKFSLLKEYQTAIESNHAILTLKLK